MQQNENFAKQAEQAEQAEAERPEVVAYADPIAFATFKRRGHEGGVVGREWMWAKPSAGLVAMSRTDECECIIGELRTEIAMLRSYESEWELLLNQHEQDRDAALARVDELKSKLAELEMQVPVAFLYRGTDIGDQLSLIRLDHYWRPKYSTEEHDYIKGIPLYAAPVAQAQHSVPEVSGIGRDFAHPRSVVLYLRTEPTDDDLRAIHDGLLSLAAAPGKEVGHE